METKETLIILRNIFYKCFFIGLFFLILAAVLYLPCECYIANLYHNAFGIDIGVYHNLWAIFIGLIKTILVFLFLVPALAIHWVSADYNRKHKT